MSEQTTHAKEMVEGLKEITDLLMQYEEGDYRDGSILVELEEKDKELIQKVVDSKWTPKASRYVAQATVIDEYLKSKELDLRKKTV